MKTQHWVGLALALGLASMALAEDQGERWRDQTLAPAERAEALVAALSLPQKFQQLVGNAPEIVPELPDCLGDATCGALRPLACPPCA